VTSLDSIAAPIAIIGGGIIGATTAWRLAQRGFKITLHEKGKLGSEASWAGAGMLSPGEMDQPFENAELFFRSRNLYRSFVPELVKATGVAIDYRECGAIDLAYSADEAVKLREKAARQQAFGIRSREITPDQVRVFSPYVQTEGLVSALFYPGDGIVDPRNVMTALRVACAQAGVDLRENSPVASIAVDAGAVRINGECFAAAILAAGAWSGGIPVSGVPALPPSEPVKGHLMGFDLQLGACPTIIRHGHNYLLQRGSGFLIAGASAEHLGFHREISKEIADQLYQEASQILPVLEKLHSVDVWTGLRPGAEKLQLGQWHNSRLFLAYGHYRNGILLAPGTAEYLTEEIDRAKFEAA
jgi:glycine oxidase